MTRKHFSSLSKRDKKIVLLKTASFLAERKMGMFRVMLYQSENFYTEVFFFKWSRKIAGFRSFHSTSHLKPYLRQIDVSSLMEEVMH